MAQFTAHYKYTMNGWLTIDADTKKEATQKFKEIFDSEDLSPYDPEEDCMAEDDLRIISIEEEK